MEEINVASFIVPISKVIVTGGTIPVVGPRRAPGWRITNKENSSTNPLFHFDFPDAEPAARPKCSRKQLSFLSLPLRLCTHYHFIQNLFRIRDTNTDDFIFKLINIHKAISCISEMGKVSTMHYCRLGLNPRKSLIKNSFFAEILRVKKGKLQSSNPLKTIATL
ncbi:MAG: hypothetical protein WD824_24125 [Cyclobacteriaceae bacterium]